MPPLGLEELQGRRALAVRQLETGASASNATGGSAATFSSSSSAVARVAALLEEEAAIEASLREAQAAQQLAAVTSPPRRYQVQLHMGLLGTAACCTASIAGCYAPDGYHAEKVLEVGVRCDQGFLVLWDEESGAELENVEVLLTNQGLLCFQAYTCGHNADTGAVWATALKMLVESNLVPAVLLPAGFPSARAFGYVCRHIGTEQFGVRLEYAKDFCTSYCSYFDSSPDKLRGGHDIILSRTNVGSLALPFGLKRTSSHDRLPTTQTALALHRDLAAHLVACVVTRMEADTRLAPFRILGGPLALYVGKLLESGVADEALLAAGFDLERWNLSTRKGRARKPKHKPGPGGQPSTAAAEHMSEAMSEAQRLEVLARVASMAHEQLFEFVRSTDLDALYQHNRMHFDEVRSFFVAATSSAGSHPVRPEHTGSALPDCFLADDFLRKTRRRLDAVLLRYLSMVPIKALSRADQQALMRWIFRNEDRVWRHRGGRPGHETVHEFLGFLADRLPGVVLLSSPLEATADSAEPSPLHTAGSLCLDEIAGYAIGEHVSDAGHPSYEIVAAFVEPKLKGLGLATRMYMHLFGAIKSPHATFEVLPGAWQRVIETSTMLRALAALRLLPLLVDYGPTASALERSTATQAGEQEEERFQKLVVHLRPVQWLLAGHCKAFCGLCI